MPTPTLLLDLPGLSGRLLDRLPDDRRPDWLHALLERGRTAVEPALPAVTMPVQATFTTGLTPAGHGVVANGFAGFRDPSITPHLDLDSFPDYRRHVSFWEQSNDLLTADRVWADRPADHTVAMLFWQSAMAGAADIVVTPKPEHTPDGRTVSLLWTDPPDLNDTLTEKLGPFPLMNYWGPFAGLAGSQWIAACARHVWTEYQPDLQLTYLPHLDYGLQTRGPGDPKMVDELAELLTVLTPLVDRAQADGARVLLLSEYGMTPVSRPCPLNVHLRRAGLLTLNTVGEVDYDRTPAFAMVDHQAAHIYTRDEQTTDRAADLLRRLDEVADCYVGDERRQVGLDTVRAGDLVAFAAEDAWFEYRWWEDFAEAPDYAWTVDIHRKPGYDPTEMLGDPVRKRTRADAANVIRGSHGRRPADPADWPLLLGVEDRDNPLPAPDVAHLLHP